MGGLIVTKGRCAKVFLVEFRGFIYVHDIVDQFLVRSKIVGVDEAIRVKVAGGLMVAPKDGDRVHGEGVIHLFGRPTEALLVFKGNDEAVGSVKLKLRFMTRNPREAAIIDGTTDGVDFTALVQGLEKLDPAGHRSVSVAREQGAKAGLGAEDRIPVCLYPDQRIGRAVECKDGNMELAGIGRPNRQDGVVALFPVRGISLMVDVDLDAVIETVPVPSQGIDQKIWAFISADGVFLLKDRKKKILKLRRAVGKVQADYGLATHVASAPFSQSQNL